MDWIFNYVDTLDIIVLTAIAIVGGYFFSGYYLNKPEETSSNTANGSAVVAQKTDRSFLGRMKSENRQVLILFGSQTGTAEELAGRLAKDLQRYGKKPLVMDPEEMDTEDLPKITGNYIAYLINQSL
jgi:NADPH-ferrihemoprotein reductase